MPRQLALLFRLLPALLLFASPAHAAAFNNIDTHAKLVNAINTANGNSEADTINITSNITLTADLPAITSVITINGGGFTLDGNDQHRAFNVNVAAANLVLNNWTLTQMRAPSNSTGGAIAIWMAAGVTLNRVTVRDSESWYTADGTTTARAAGGVYCQSSSLTIRDSAFFNNVASEGGAISLGFACATLITRSSFYNNRAQEDGGALAVGYASGLTMNHSTIYGNRSGVGDVEGRGSGLYVSGTNTASPETPRAIRLNHVTMTGNQGKVATDGALHWALGNVQLHVSNSLIYGNTTGRDCARTGSNVPQLITNSGNIIGTGNCGTPTGVFGAGGDPQLPASATGSPPYFALPQSSPAVDGAACISGLNQDQRGRPRPSGVRCDIGAYEYQYPPPPPQIQRPDDSGSASGSASDQDAPAPLSTCLTLDGISAFNINPQTQCQRINALQIANPAIKDGDFVDAVDVWAWVTPASRICFEAAGSAFTFIDTAAMPRSARRLAAFLQDGYTCTDIDGPGMLILLPGDTPAAAPATAALGLKPANRRSLTNCMVTANAVLHLRDAPAGTAIGYVSKGWKLTAMQRTDYWFQVDRLGVTGWIFKDYVTTDGACD